MSGSLADIRDEARRLLDALLAREVPARAVGGLAVHLRCPSAHHPPLARDYKDIDLVVTRDGSGALTHALTELGYRPDEEFNALQPHRLLFWDDAHGRQLDVFIDEMKLCHVLDLRRRLPAGEQTLAPADLLLAKLQVVEVNEKDLQDSAALLADHGIAPDGIDPDRIVEVLAADWGWWRTVTETLGKVDAYAASLPDLSAAPLVRERIAELRDRVEAAPKSRRWRLRAKVGERKRWYELPEEVSG